MKTTLILIAAVSLAGWITAAESNQPAARLNKSEPATGQLLMRGAELQRARQNEEALQLYRQAMLGGNPEGAFLAGKLSWETALTAKGKAQVLKRDAGLRYFYQAATNGHAAACLSLSQAFRDGVVVPADLSFAYAWLVVAKRFDPTIPLQTLDELAVKLDAAALSKAQQQARHWLVDGWTGIGVPEIVQGDQRLKINGISWGNTASVMINLRTFMNGDSATIPPLLPGVNNDKTASGNLEVTVAAIGLDYVLVRIAGEESLRLLAFDPK